MGNIEFWIRIIYLSPILLGYLIGIVRNDIAKEIVISNFLKGFPVEELKKKIGSFCNILDRILNENTINTLLDHKNKNHSIILISASLEIYIKPWGSMWGFDHSFGTKLEIINGKLTGKISGQNCYGPEKAVKLKSLYTNLDDYYIICYGDSKGDKELFDLANEYYML